MKGIKKLLAAGLAGLLLTVPVGAEETTWEEIPNANIPAAVIQKEVAEAEGMQVALSLPVKSAILIDQNTGTVRYEMNADEKLPPASITKIMSLLLFMEALDSGKIALTDTVTCSEAAAGFGGSQIWLKPGEEMTVDDLLKAVAVQSANDATVCLAEYVAGSEEAFVQLMNQKAAELGMENTHFACCAGLDNEGHYSTARDIALMSRALLRYPKITDYTTIWMDTLRNGATSLVNTNRLVRFYQGATGLKTGFTEKAMYCLSATAEREGVEYIAVIMHADTIDKRNNDAKVLLSYGFANYRLMPLRSPDVLPPVRVTLGSADSVQPVYDGAEAALVPKNGIGEVSYELDLPDTLPAPVEKGQQIGTLRVVSDGKEIYTVKLLADSSVGRASFGRTLLELVKSYVGLG